MRVIQKNKIIFSILCVIFVFVITRFYYFITDDFRLSNIYYKYPFETPWTSPPLTVPEIEQVLQILNQKFTYLGKGAQCYAFQSADKKYVLKFFKFKHLKPNILIDHLPDIYPFKNYKDKCIARKKRKLIGVFSSYDLAFKEIPQTSHLSYIHLIPTTFLNQSVTLIDKIGFQRKVDLDTVFFLLQPMGETFGSRLHTFLQNNNINAARECINQILQMYLLEYQQGIYDHDHGVMQNTGFFENQAFHLDVGKVIKNDQMKEMRYAKNDFKQVIWKIHQWISKNFPLLSMEFTQFLEEKYFEITGDQVNLSQIQAKDFPRTRLWN